MVRLTSLKSITRLDDSGLTINYWPACPAAWMVPTPCTYTIASGVDADGVEQAAS